MSIRDRLKKGSEKEEPGKKRRKRKASRRKRKAEEAEFIRIEELEKLIAEIQKQMKKAASELNFEAAAELRDRMISLKKHLQEIDD